MYNVTCLHETGLHTLLALLSLNCFWFSLVHFRQMFLIVPALPKFLQFTVAMSVRCCSCCLSCGCKHSARLLPPFGHSLFRSSWVPQISLTSVLPCNLPLADKETQKAFGSLQLWGTYGLSSIWPTTSLSYTQKYWKWLWMDFNKLEKYRMSLK